MKKLKFCILLVFLLFLYGCSTDDATASPIRTYVLEHSEFPFTSAYLNLLEDNKFSFMLNPLSSFFPMGTYSVQGNRLILTVGDEIAYVFSIEGDILIFIADESWEIPSFCMSADATASTPSFEDGDRFILQ